ncbi:MAG: hypothetical protein KKF77_03540 [Proteobacteria bacterium]|nr:hypothetical protein [Pseudomonadota bacterium]
MQQLHANRLTRQQRLKVWAIENSFDYTALVQESGISKQAVSRMLIHQDTIPASFRDLCLNQGIPADLLPPPTRPKAELLRENQELRARLAKYEPQAQAS